MPPNVPNMGVEIQLINHLLHYFTHNRGNDFLKPLIILDQSILRGGDNLGKISEYIAKGENVVILSNHQTEADPQVSNIIIPHFII